MPPGIFGEWHLETSMAGAEEVVRTGSGQCGTSSALWAVPRTWAFALNEMRTPEV